MSESPITPSVGRIVLVRGPAACSDGKGREVPGIVTRVWSQNVINVRVQRDPEEPVLLTSVTFDDSEAGNETWASWRWMPYQVAKAASEPAQIDLEDAIAAKVDA